MPALLKPIQLSRQLLSGVVRAGDTVVDATLGNGNDALFLSKLVGNQGMVFGFDIQEMAIVNSSKLMQDHKVNVEHYQFLHAGHETMEKHIQDKVSAFMFNLGYLPRADKSIITCVETTLSALEQATRMLKNQGLISVMCYPGHDGGEQESAAVRAWCSQLPREGFQVMEYGLLNATNQPPFLIAIEKVEAI